MTRVYHPWHWQVPCRGKQVPYSVLALCVLLLASTANGDKVGMSRSTSNNTADGLVTQRNSAWVSTRSDINKGNISSISSSIHLHYPISSSRSRTRIKSTAESQQSSVRDGGRRIIGGHPATGTYRWVTKIEKLGGQWTGCVGNLISKKWMLTAAHCILNGQNTGYKSGATAGNTKIRYGCLNTDSASCKIADAVRYIAHPCYTPSDDQDHDDIALIELRAPVQGMPAQFLYIHTHTHTHTHTHVHIYVYTYVHTPTPRQTHTILSTRHGWAICMGEWAERVNHRDNRR